MIEDIGSRVDYEGAKGTIKWVGEIEGVKGQWIGVDWDDEQRGKHDGSHKGIQYFHTRFKNSGSFVRPAKVNYGITLEEAIRGRYQDDYKIEETVTDQFRRNIKANFVEVVGMEKIGKKQSALDCLQTAVLDGWSVRNGGTTDLRAMLPRLNDLILSNCLLSSWDDVASITKQLPNLRLLDVSGNRLRLPENPSDLIQYTGHITHLVLNKMITYSWEDLMMCVQAFPGLQKLQMAFNNLSTLGSIPPGSFEDLVDIDMGVNPVEDWEEICKLGKLLRLEIMNLNGCKLKKIVFPDIPAGGRTPLFPRLRSLMVAKNPLELWSSIGELDKLASLNELILSNEAVEGRSNHFHEFTLGRIRNLKTLNRTTVDIREKKDCQIFYLRTFSREYYENGGTENPDDARVTEEFIRTHPSYLLVTKICGTPADERFHVPQKSQKLRHLKIDVVLIHENGEEIVKSFLPATKIAKFKMMIRAAFGLPGNTNISLIYYPDKNEKKFEIELDNDMKDLHYYSVQSGDVIRIRT